MEKGKITEAVNNATPKKSYSPYKVAKIESQLRGKNIPPQKLYGYVRQGYITATLNELNKMEITQEEARRYLVKTLSNNV